MGSRGPAPRPTALRLLNGETRPSRINQAEPLPPDAELEPPEWLGSGGRQEWDRIVGDLTHMRVGRRIDSTALGVLAELTAQFALAARLVDQDGVLIKDKDGNPRRNPAALMARGLADEIRLMSREFGLTPASRASLTTSTMPAWSHADRLLS